MYVNSTIFFTCYEGRIWIDMESHYRLRHITFHIVKMYKDKEVKFFFLFLYLNTVTVTAATFEP
jgi:hypothetical protein